MMFLGEAATEQYNMLLMLTTFTLLLCAVKIQTESICDDTKGQDIVIDALRLNTIHLDLPGTLYTWQATRGTQNLTIQSTDDVTVTTDVSGRQLRISAAKNDVSAASTVCALPAVCIAILACLVSPRIAQSKWTIFLLLAFTAVSSGFGGKPECFRTGSIHLLIPSEIIETISVGGRTIPILCQLNVESPYSNVPSNNELLFEDDQCSIKKPERWDEWLEHYFGPNSTQSYLHDSDNDGLVNILEYHGTDAFEGAFLYFVEEGNTTTTAFRRRCQTDDIGAIGTSPVDPDSDGDLLLDGFEVSASHISLQKIIGYNKGCKFYPTQTMQIRLSTNQFLCNLMLHYHSFSIEWIPKFLTIEKATSIRIY